MIKLFFRIQIRIF